MSITYKQFKKETMGKGWDIDGAYGNQCWDYVMYYFKKLGYPVFSCTDSGYVKDIYLNRKKNGILKYFDEVEWMEPGDVAIFKETNVTPYSHIAIFDSDAGNGYGNFLGQNQPEAYVTLAKLPYSATYQYALRPKCFVKTKIPETKDAVYRLYNPNSGQHVFTAKHDEAVSLNDKGWKYEGVAFKTGNKIDVYRAYNPSNGNHVLTVSKVEIDSLVKAGWKNEGVAFKAPDTGKSVYRLYNKNDGDHLFTTDSKERDNLKKAGWNDEGTAFYAG